MENTQYEEAPQLKEKGNKAGSEGGLPRRFEVQMKGEGEK